MAGGWEDAGSFVPLYKPLPMVRMPDITDANLNGAGPAPFTKDVYEITAAQLKIFDTIATPQKLEVSVDGGAWTELPLKAHDGIVVAPTAPGDSYETEPTDNYAVTGLNVLRDSDLGTRQRYLFRGTNIFGFTAYEELILEVRLDVATGYHSLHAINLGTDAAAAAPTVPENRKVRFKVTPTLDDDVRIVELSTTMWLMQDSDTAVEQSFLTMAQTEDTTASTPPSPEFVFVDDSRSSVTTVDDVYPFIARNFDDAASSKLDVNSQPIAQVVYFDLAAFLADDDTEATNAVTVRHNPNAVTSFSESRFLMMPVTLKMNPTTLHPDGSVKLSLASGAGNVSIWDESGAELTLPKTYQIDDLTFPVSNPNLKLYVNGINKNTDAELLVEYTYKGRVISSDRVKLRVKTIPGLAGEELTGGFPYINYVGTYNKGQSNVHAGIDPFVWSQITQNQVLPDSGERPSAKYYVVPHKDFGTWATDSSLAGGGASASFSLDGRSIQYNVKQAWAGAATTAGDYDLVLDIANELGENTPNGQLDPGDIIGRWKPSADDAEVHVVVDPLAKADVHANFGYVDYGSAPGGAGDTFTIPIGADGNGADVTDNYIHGRIYYPADNTVPASGNDVLAETGSFPLVVVLHGNHNPLRAIADLVTAGVLTAAQGAAITSAENYLGYTYLQEELARQGYVSVSVDLDRYASRSATAAAPFGWPTTVAGGIVTENGIRARAWTVAMNVDRVRTFNAAGSGNRIEGRVDFNDVTLIGHSRGGEAVVELAVYRNAMSGPFAVAGPGTTVAPFDITRVISVSPTSIHTGSVDNRPYLVFHGAADGDVPTAAGFKLYDVATGLKSMQFIEGASHNFFKTSWPTNDATHTLDGNPASPTFGDIVHLQEPGPGGFVNYDIGANLLARATQQDLLMNYSLAWIWGGHYQEYFSRPADRLLPSGLANVKIQNQFRKPSGAIVLDDFESNGAGALSSSGGTVAGQRFTGPIAADKDLNDQANHYYNETKCVVLEWDTAAHGTAVYEQQTTAVTRDASGSDFLSFRIGSHYQETVAHNLTLEFTDDSGNVFYIETKRLAEISAPYDAKFDRDYRDPATNITKMAFQTFRISLAAIQLDGRPLNQSHIQSIRLIFDKTAKGKVVIDDIEFSN